MKHRSLLKANVFSLYRKCTQHATTLQWSCLSEPEIYNVIMEVLKFQVFSVWSSLGFAFWTATTQTGLIVINISWDGRNLPVDELSV